MWEHLLEFFVSAAVGGGIAVLVIIVVIVMALAGWISSGSH